MKTAPKITNSRLLNGGPGSGRRPGQDPDANSFLRLVERIRREGTPYRRNGSLGFTVRGLRLGPYKLEGDVLRSKNLTKHGRDSDTVLGV